MAKLRTATGGGCLATATIAVDAVSFQSVTVSARADEGASAHSAATPSDAPRVRAVLTAPARLMLWWFMAAASSDAPTRSQHSANSRCRLGVESRHPCERTRLGLDGERRCVSGRGARPG